MGATRTGLRDLVPRAGDVPPRIADALQVPGNRVAIPLEEIHVAYQYLSSALDTPTVIGGVAVSLYCDGLKRGLEDLDVALGELPYFFRDADISAELPTFRNRGRNGAFFMVTDTSYRTITSMRYYAPSLEPLLQGELGLSMKVDMIHPPGNNPMSGGILDEKNFFGIPIESIHRSAQAISVGEMSFRVATAEILMRMKRVAIKLRGLELDREDLELLSSLHRQS